MDCILGIGGAHMVTLDPGARHVEVATRGHYARVLSGLQKVLANEVTSYLGSGKQEKAQYVLLILLLLCVYEVSYTAEIFIKARLLKCASIHKEI